METARATKAIHLPTIDGKPYCDAKGSVIASRSPRGDYGQWLSSITCPECKSIARAKNT